MKILTITIPCYNSQDYIERCLTALLTGGEEIEILIVNDGSTDDTPAIADRYAAAYPSVIRTIHQENAGHGGAIMTGLRNATGQYFKVVDSDDWVDGAAMAKVLDCLRAFVREGKRIDLLLTNYIYEKMEAGRSKEIRYKRALREGDVLTWDDVHSFRPWQNLLMHSLIYRTEVVRESGLDLPKNTFYVDNLFCTVPMKKVESLYYMDIGLYHYVTGRKGQSVQEDIMIRRIDQQILVNKLMLEQLDLEHIHNSRQKKTLLHYLDMITTVTNIMLILGGTQEHLKKKKMLWQYIRQNYPWEYKKLRYGLFGIVMNLPGKVGRWIDIVCYRIANRFFSFN